MHRVVVRFLLLSLLASLAGPVVAGSCIQRFVDTQAGNGSLADAISEINAFGCASGGLNEIIIDNVALSEIVIGSLLPEIEKPTRLAPPVGAVDRFPIRTNQAFLFGYGLRASARVVIENVEILGESSRRFFGGIRLEAGADGSALRGVRIDRVRGVGISVSGVSDVVIEPSSDWPVVVTGSGFGENVANPLFAPGISISSATDVTVRGAYLGIDESGSAAGNCSYGIDVINSSLVQIGGNASNADQRNVIGDNRFGGIRMTDSVLVTVSGNYIGVADDRTTVLGNGLSGTCFASPPAGEFQAAGVVVVGSDFVSLGEGTAPNTGSFIVGNQGGVRIDDSQSVTLLRNRIGVRPDNGESPNVGDAVRIINGSGTAGRVLIGSDDHQRANWIVGGGSSSDGVFIDLSSGEVRLRTNRIFGFRAGGDEAIQHFGAPVAPVVTEADSDTGVIAGMFPSPLPADGVVDIFTDFGGGDDEARFYMGSAPVIAGATTFAATVNGVLLFEGRRVLATYTHEGANSPGTSELGVAATAMPAPEFTVTPSAGAGGSISPDLPQVVGEGQTVVFTLSADPGFEFGSVGGSCGGSRVGATYTTDPVVADCTVIATFTSIDPPDFVVTPSRIDFGPVPPGTAATPVTVTVQNLGSGSGTLDGLQLLGRHALDFTLPAALDGCSNQGLPAGGSCQFRVDYTPTAPGLREARVVVGSDDPSGPLTVDVRGTFDVVFADDMESLP